MAQTNLKESLQCLAFAFYAENPNMDSQHEQKWIDIFDPDMEQSGSDMRNTYSDYLSPTFSSSIFESVIKKYQSKFTKTGKISVNIAVKKVYLVVKKVVQSNFFGKPLKDYKFLDQSDPFTLTVKDACLGRIAKAFGMTGKADLLSSVDLFAVRRNKITDILSEFNTHILNATDEELLANMSWGTTGKNTYRTITNKFFSNRYLVGISLKLPESIAGAGVLKIVGTETVDPHLLDFVDPYTKLIAAMLAHPQSTTKLIEDVVDIEFDNFRITPSLLSWEYPITFRYKDVLDPRFTDQPLYKNNLRFKLFTWSNAGFNAQWYKGQNAPGNWTGGAGTDSLGELFIKYSEYSGILDELIEIREQALYYALTGKDKDAASTINSKFKQLYSQALVDIRQKKIITPDSSKNLIKFCKEYSPTKNLFEIYQTEVVKRATKPMKSASRTVTKDVKRLNAHYTASQCAWFLFRGGSSLHKYLKKRMFLSLFGLITKSGYKIFQGNEETIMEDYIKTKYKKNNRNVVAYFNAAPHIVLS
jgi:hypothetical protein